MMISYGQIIGRQQLKVVFFKFLRDWLVMVEMFNRERLYLWGEIFGVLCNSVCGKNVKGTKAELSVSFQDCTKN